MWHQLCGVQTHIVSRQQRHCSVVFIQHPVRIVGVNTTASDILRRQYLTIYVYGGVGHYRQVEVTDESVWRRRLPVRYRQSALDPDISLTEDHLIGIVRIVNHHHILARIVTDSDGIGRIAQAPSSVAPSELNSRLSRFMVRPPEYARLGRRAFRVEVGRRCSGIVSRARGQHICLAGKKLDLYCRWAVRGPKRVPTTVAS